MSDQQRTAKRVSEVEFLHQQVASVREEAKDAEYWRLMEGGDLWVKSPMSLRRATLPGDSGERRGRLKVHPLIGENGSAAKLNDSDIIPICLMYRDKRMTLKEIGKSFGVKEGCIRKIINCQSFKHIERPSGCSIRSSVGYRRRGKDHHATVLGPSDVGKVRDLYRSGIGPRTIARQFGVHENTILCILKGETHKGVRDFGEPIVLRGHASPRLSNAQRAEVRRLGATGESQRSLARKFRVSPVTIFNVIHHKKAYAEFGPNGETPTLDPAPIAETEP